MSRRPRRPAAQRPAASASARSTGTGRPVARWLPGAVPNGHRITVRQLLNHTSGLPDYRTTLRLPPDPAFLTSGGAPGRRGSRCSGRWRTRSS